MSFTPIIGTPLQVTVGFNRARAGEEDSGAQDVTDLASSGGAVIFALLGLPAQLQQDLARALSAPLEDSFHVAWQADRPRIGLEVQDAIRGGTAGAYDIFVIVPDRGSLHAEVTGLSPGMRETLPLGVEGAQLNFSYRVPNINGLYTMPTDTPLGKWADPVVSFAFDARLMIYVAVPNDAGVPIGLRATFFTENTKGGLAPGIGNLMWGFLAALRRAFTGAPDNDPPGVTRDLGRNEIGALGAQFAQLSAGFAQAAAMGFTRLDPAVFDAGLGATVGLRLTHPFDDPPTLFMRGASSGPSFFRPTIGTSVPAANAGATFTVLGSSFPEASATVLRVDWNDTARGPVVRTEVQWGAYPGAPPQPASAPPVAQSAMVDYRRTPANPNPPPRYTFTTPRTLAPDTWYGVRVRDFAPMESIATRWSAWTPFRTAASDRVELRLEWAGTSAVIGSALLSSDGSFAADVTIPAAVPPGTYPIWAMHGGQDLAFAPIRVVAQNAQVPASLQVLSSDTGIPVVGAAMIAEGSMVTLQGSGFPPGPVQLHQDTAGGTVLGQATADASGAFKTPVRWPLGVARQHSVVAVGAGNATASAAIFVNLLPR